VHVDGEEQLPQRVRSVRDRLRAMSSLVKRILSMTTHSTRMHPRAHPKSVDNAETASNRTM